MRKERERFTVIVTDLDIPDRVYCFRHFSMRRALRIVKKYLGRSVDIRVTRDSQKMQPLL